MENPIVKNLIIAGAVAMTLALVGLAWFLINDNDVATEVSDLDVSQFKTKGLCVGAGGSWDSANSACT